ncbi:MAG: NUDIX domain-containing protein [Candidatus Heimdallarchaeaceae archaeon]
MRKITIDELKEKYEELFSVKYKRVAWGYVPKLINGSKHILVAERCKKDDPERYGELVIPGGTLEEGEDYIDAAIREVGEETGLNVRTALLEPKSLVNPIGYGFPTVLREREKIISITDSNGNVFLYYLDSGKSYVGRMFLLEPVVGSSIRESGESDARRPKWMPKDEVKKRRSDFTPACQILLELVEEFETQEEPEGILIEDSLDKLYRELGVNP